MDDVRVPEDLFKDVKYYACGTIQEKLLSFLEAGGASNRNYLSHFVTHAIVGKDCIENELQEASELYDIPVLHESWVLVSAHAQKLLPHAGFDATPGRLFSGSNVCFTNVDSSDVVRLWSAVTFHGGRVTREFRPDAAAVTHLVTTKAAGRKYGRALQVGENKVKGASRTESSFLTHVVGGRLGGERADLAAAAAGGGQQTAAAAADGLNVAAADGRLVDLCGRRRLVDCAQYRDKSAGGDWDCDNGRNTFRLGADDPSSRFCG